MLLSPLPLSIVIGHILHMNLRDEQLPYKEVIGEVILDKNKQVASHPVNYREWLRKEHHAQHQIN